MTVGKKDSPIIDINNDDSLDISISLRLTERTLVKEVDGALHVSYALNRRCQSR